MTSAVQLVLLGGIVCCLTFQGTAISTVWLVLNLYDTFLSLRQVRPNGRRIGLNTRRKVMREALISWVVYVAVQSIGWLPDMVLGWLPLYAPLRSIFLLAFLGIRTASSSSLYYSLIVPMLKRYETPIDLTLLLFHSIFLLVCHYILILPLHRLRNLTSGLVSWTRQKKSSKNEAVEGTDVDVHTDSTAEEVEVRRKQIVAGHNSISLDTSHRVIPSTHSISINVSTPSPPKHEIAIPRKTPARSHASLRPSSPPMTLRRSPRRPSPSPNPTIDGEEHQAGPSTLPSLRLPVQRKSNKTPSLPATESSQRKTGLASAKSTVSKPKGPIRRLKVAPPSLGGSLALHQAHPRSARPVGRDPSALYPKLPDLPPNLLQLPVISRPAPPNIAPPRDTAASRSRNARLAASKSGEQASTGSKRRAGDALDANGQKRKRLKPSGDDKG